MASLRKASGFKGCGGDPVLLCNMDSESHDYEMMVFMVDSVTYFCMASFSLTAIYLQITSYLERNHSICLSVN